MLLMFLEGLAYAQEEPVGFTLTEIWMHSGFIARAVIITLALMFVATFVVAIERFIAFQRARTHSMKLASEIVGPLQQGDVGSASKVANDEAYRAGYLTGLLKAGLGELKGGVNDHTVANAKRAIEKAHSEELAKAQRGMTILATTGSTAPFVGLFGTTFGVINAFQGMAEAGSGLASISAGISEALITTGVGIGVAVWGVWLFNYFNQRIAKLGDELNSSEADFLQWAHKLVQGN